MQVVLPLIFREIFGLMQLSDVVIKGRGAREIDVLAQRRGACLRQLSDHHGMIEGAGRLFLQLFEQLRVRAGQLAQAEYREAVENRFEHGQKGEEKHGGHNAAEKAVAHLRKHPLDPRGLRRKVGNAARKPGHFQKKDNHVDGNDDDQPDPHDLEAGLGLIAEENGDMERDYAYTIGRAMSDLQTPEWVGADCARRTLSRLSPRKLSTMKAPVIFANEVATGLFGHLVGAIAGGSVYRKSTFLLDSLGKQILPDWLTIEEHPHLLKGLASTPFDSEGVRTERRDIIKDGILTQWLLTSYSARKLGLKSTGHAGGIHNWRIAGQGLSFEQMLKEMGTGLVVTELMGQGVSAITGDYSRGAAGFWVENGEIQYPVSEITIAGNLKDMWRNIVTVGNDIETRSNIQCGSVLLPEMKIAGQ